MDHYIKWIKIVKIRTENDKYRRDIIWKKLPTTMHYPIIEWKNYNISTLIKLECLVKICKGLSPDVDSSIERIEANWLLIHLKSAENHEFSDDFEGNRS